jgi:hypothetical protein
MTKRECRIVNEYGMAKSDWTFVIPIYGLGGVSGGGWGGP